MDAQQEWYTLVDRTDTGPAQHDTADTIRHYLDVVKHSIINQLKNQLWELLFTAKPLHYILRAPEHAWLESLIDSPDTVQQTQQPIQYQTQLSEIHHHPAQQLCFIHVCQLIKKIQTLHQHFVEQIELAENALQQFIHSINTMLHASMSTSSQVTFPLTPTAVVKSQHLGLYLVPLKQAASV